MSHSEIVFTMTTVKGVYRYEREGCKSVREEHKSAGEEHKSAGEEHKSAGEEHKSAGEGHKGAGNIFTRMPEKSISVCKRE